MTSIRIEKTGPVAVLRLEHGKANALDTGLCRELAAKVDESGARALVLAGSAKVFSAGVDLRRIRDGGAPYVREFLPALSDAFLAVFGFPGPTVAAVTGHAIAGGAVLAAACDRRVMASGAGRFGLTELAVGVPFPLVAIEVLRCAYGDPVLSELALSGRTYAAPDALARNLVHELAAPDAVVSRATEVALELAAAPEGAFAHTKAQLHHPFDERIGEQRAADDGPVEAMWSSPETLASIGEYVRRVLERG
ncbi:enoyl-CoA hydratase/isomerase family protein [Amycolatopsis acidicola]|uniref:Enoyl-CoA hydratase/isomerase family protein n=1 Tax=Amycolatopsis acidicola TaxID=2596893 RepID=A0A5N0UZS8_9PSEU|nr:enoyl-CoA hydratase/isomerase family protein [Amycolatopsis acidicola]KAA9157167.1 enoyl-CoA hydratase/isomerase family protein [Amycolatopsis acidicola]